MFPPMSWFPAKAVQRTRRFWRRYIVVGTLVCVLPLAYLVGLRIYSWHLSLNHLDNLASAEDLIESFDRVVHSHDSSDVAFKYPIAKWPAVLPVYFDASVPMEHKRSIIALFPEIQAITKLTFVEAAAFKPQGQMNIFWADDLSAIRRLEARYDVPKGFSSGFEEANCYFITVRGRNQSELARFVVFKNEPEDVWSYMCILEEFVQALGLHSDRATYLPSLFSEFTDPLDIPLNDKILLRALYDPAITHGMTVDDTRRLVPGIIRRLVADVEARGTEALYQR